MNKHIEEIVREFEQLVPSPRDGTLEEKIVAQNHQVKMAYLKDWLRTTLLTYAAKEREELREKVEKLIKKLPEREFVDERAEKGAYNSAILRVLSLLTPEPPTSPKEK